MFLASVGVHISTFGIRVKEECPIVGFIGRNRAPFVSVGEMVPSNILILHAKSLIPHILWS